MSRKVYQSQIVLLYLTVLGSLWGASASQKDATPLVSKSVLFVRGPAKQAPAPNGKAAITLSAPANEDSESKIEARSKRKILQLGDLRRSASVFWRPDSRAAALWDHAYSNHFFVRLIRLEPSLYEVKGFDQMIRRRVFKEFRFQDLVHYWPYVKGWTKQGDLVVVVCADGTPRGSGIDTPFVGFERGYVIDTDALKIRSEFASSEFVRMVGTNPCE